MYELIIANCNLIVKDFCKYKQTLMVRFEIGSHNSKNSGKRVVKDFKEQKSVGLRAINAWCVMEFGKLAGR